LVEKVEHDGQDGILPPDTPSRAAPAVTRAYFGATSLNRVDDVLRGGQRGQLFLRSDKCLYGIDKK
jgi:hypothetical protein